MSEDGTDDSDFEFEDLEAVARLNLDAPDTQVTAPQSSQKQHHQTLQPSQKQQDTALQKTKETQHKVNAVKRKAGKVKSTPLDHKTH